MRETFHSFHLSDPFHSIEWSIHSIHSIPFHSIPIDRIRIKDPDQSTPDWRLFRRREAGTVGPEAEWADGRGGVAGRVGWRVGMRLGVAGMRWKSVRPERGGGQQAAGGEVESIHPQLSTRPITERSEYPVSDGPTPNKQQGTTEKDNIPFHLNKMSYF